VKPAPHVSRHIIPSSPLFPFSISFSLVLHRRQMHPRVSRRVAPSKALTLAYKSHSHMEGRTLAARRFVPIFVAADVCGVEEWGRGVGEQNAGAPSS
jgi:hypothetical protein